MSEALASDTKILFGKPFKSPTPEEFADVYDLYAPRVFRHVLSRVGDRGTAEDIAAQTFLNAWDYFQKPHNAIENIRAFIYRISHNLITDYYRKKHLETVRLETLPEHHRALRASQNIEERFEEKDTVRIVEETLGVMGDDYRDMIVWRYIDELSVEEISEISGKTPNAVYVTLHRALKKVRILLKERDI